MTSKEFNELFAVGTPVVYWSYTNNDGSFGGYPFETKTRSEAFDSNAGYPVVFVEKKSGYVLLSHVVPIKNFPIQKF